MKKILMLMMLTVMSFTLCGFGQCEAAKKVVAVTEIVNSCSTGDGRIAAQELESEIVTALVKSGLYDVMERGQLNAVMKELGLNSTGLVGANAQEFGKMTGADYSVVGNVIVAEVAKFDKGLGGISNFLGGFGKVAKKVDYKGTKAKVKFNFKFIDNKTGQIKISEVIEGSESVTTYENSRPDHNLMLSAAVNDVSKKIVELINTANPVVGTVAEIVDNTIYTDIGKEMGVQVGDTYRVYRDGKIITNPRTGDIITVVKVDVAEVRIIESNEGYSVAQVKSAKKPIQAGDKLERSKK